MEKYNQQGIDDNIEHESVVKSTGKDEKKQD